MTAVRSIRAVIILNFSGLVFILLDGAKVGIFEVPENKSLSGFLDGDDGGGLKTVFFLKFELSEESSFRELRGLVRLFETLNYAESSGSCS